MTQAIKRNFPLDFQCADHATVHGISGVFGAGLRGYNAKAPFAALPKTGGHEPAKARLARQNQKLGDNRPSTKAVLLIWPGTNAGQRSLAHV